jgi:hypothetical protein
MSRTWKLGRSRRRGLVAAAAVTALAGLLAGAVAARTQAKPRVISHPAVSGEPKQGHVLHGDRGEWQGHPTDFNVYWQRCGRDGHGCGKIGNTDGVYDYRLTAQDVGATLRFRVGAQNADGRTWASSPETPIVVAGAPAAPTPPPAPTGCPSALNPAQVAAISPPARLVVDGVQAEPSTVTGGARSVTLRFHVTSTCGGSVQGALVYATATPYDQFTIPPEQPTGADGWVSLRLDRLGGFPVNARQTRLLVFVRARKAGDNALAGISTRRLVSVPVVLR